MKKSNKTISVITNFTKLEKIEYSIYIMHYILFFLCIFAIIASIVLLCLELYYNIDNYYTQQIIGLGLSISYIVSFFTLARFKNIRKKYSFIFKKNGDKNDSCR